MKINNDRRLIVLRVNRRNIIKKDLLKITVKVFIEKQINSIGGYTVEYNMCEVCKNRYAVRKVDLTDVGIVPNKKVLICMHCLRDKMENGELSSEERIKYYREIKNSLEFEGNESILNNIKQENQFKNSKSKENLFVTQFGYDLTDKARKGELDPVLGREKEIHNTIRILKRRFKNNPVLVGEPGVGKTAIVEGIAQKIASGKIEESLKNKRIISVSMGNLVAGTKYRGEFEERMRKIIQEVSSRKDIILFIDELHTLIGSGGGEGALDASQLLKPALSRGEIQIIGATTTDEYRVHIEKDKALERRFQKVKVAEPSREEAIEIMKGLKYKYSKFHGIEIGEEVLEEAVNLSIKYINDRSLPDKAIDLIDEACANKRLVNSLIEEKIINAGQKIKKIEQEKYKNLKEGNYKKIESLLLEEKELNKKVLKVNNINKTKKENFITKEDLATILNDWTGIPVNEVTKTEIDKLKTLSDDLKLRVKGQNEAIEVLSRSIKRSSIGLKDDKRPIGVFLMLGPTGVGKTELSKAVTELLFGNEEAIERFDMSEYMEKHSVSKMIGSPPGYVGYEDEGKLTKRIREKPYSVILFDEIEKAHPQVLDILLQLFDEGRITDAKGRNIDAKNCLFLMTSNIGSDLYSSKKTSLGYGVEEKNEGSKLNEGIKKRLKDHFRPEMLNRIDEVLIFNRLTKEVMNEICENMTIELKEKLKEKDIIVNFSKTAIEYLANKGFDPVYGARPLRKELDNVKTMIAEKWIEEGQPKKINIGFKGQKLTLSFKKM